MKYKLLFVSLSVALWGFSTIAQAEALPELGKGKATDSAGLHSNVTSLFKGGIAVGTNTSALSAALKLAEPVNITGTIEVDPADVGKTADIVVYAAFKLEPTGAEYYFMLRKTPDGGFDIPLWDHKLENLAAFDTVTLAETQEVSLYKGNFVATGLLDIYFGYVLTNEDGSKKLVTNPEPIAARINPNEASPSPTGEFFASYSFRPNPNGYGFENYGNDAQSANDMSAEDMIALFGREKVCRSVTGDCVLNATAQEWMDKQIKGMDGGHCEGMAVTSLRLWQSLEFKGKRIPSDFQAGTNTTYEVGKDAVRNYIAYYFVTQFLEEVSAATQSFRKKPSEVLQTLIDGMNNNVVYSVGFYQPGYKGGHAVTPYAVQKKSETEFWIYVYDNNFPNDNNRVIKVDKSAETWVYEGGATRPDEPASDYRGSAETLTLELTPQTVREGKFACPFCTTETTSTNTLRATSAPKMLDFAMTGEGTLMVQLADGRRVGYDPLSGETVNEIDQAQKVNGKSGLGKNLPPQISIPYPNNNEPIVILISGKGDSEESETDLSVTAPGFVVGFEGIYLDPDEILMITLRPDGKELSFIASADGETPNVFMAFDPENNTGAGYTVDVGGISLDAGKKVTFTIDNGALLVKDEDGNEDDYDINIVRVDDNGRKTFKKDDVAVPANATARVSFTNWTGDSGEIDLQLDEEGDGFDDDAKVPLN
ncbi:hypothetical protein [Beggiatoa leptomitoformis]|uniref:Uncharacterized protein n=1 Tax=Beggiatoa leptomitoformis TaxID=288004 RepID=A0A2N9YF03_9GAMM|nr:hypothetical protein [Beggiatoa leptomitoformis]ALG68611.1 hypothetical protein AL038_13995 [Beggiatoa leptomitoformis]AUI69044.1 hypothetical protein BLE401_10260 [Beggiatoa leptomitoformis]